MDATTVAVDLAKDIFEVALANRAGRIIERKRLTRRQFERFVDGLPAGHRGDHGGVRHGALLGPAVSGARICASGCCPVQYVRPYVRRNKTDRTDTEAMLEAARCGGIQPVPVKTVEQQTLQALHRVRTQWQAARTARINVVRGLLREQGLPVPVGARTVLTRVRRDPRGRRRSRCPDLLRHTVALVVEEIRALEARIAAIDRQLAQVARDASGRAAPAADPGRGRAHRDGDGRRRESYPRVSARPGICELAGADAARILDRRSPVSRAASANAAMCICAAC